MKTKRITGLLLTATGIMGVIYTAAELTAGGQHHTTMRIIFIIVGIILAVSGIQMVKTSKEIA